MTEVTARDRGRTENEATDESEAVARATADGEEAVDATAKPEAGRARGELRLFLAALVGLIVVAAVFAVIRPASDNPNGLDPAALRASPPVRLPTVAPIREATIFATDGDLQTDNVPIWQIEPRPARVLLRPIFKGGQTVSLPLRQRPGTSYDIASWDTYEGESLFTIRQQPESIEVRVYDLLSDHRLIGSGVAPTAPPEQPGITREFAVARWTGNRSDLFVIDRGGRDERVRLSVYSGESSFSKRVSAFVLPVRGVAPAGWAVDVLRFAGDLPDLALVRRSSRSGRPELHVLTGERGFQQFALQTPVGLPVNSGSRYEFMAGSSLGRPAIYAVDARAARRLQAPRELPSHPALRVLPAGKALGPLEE